MHELGVILEIVKKVDKCVQLEHAKSVKCVVLQLGTLSGLVPRMVETCFPIAINGTALEGAKLEINIIPANGLCQDCKKVFRVAEYRSHCPICNCEHWDLLCGNEIIIKEIHIL